MKKIIWSDIICAILWAIAGTIWLFRAVYDNVDPAWLGWLNVGLEYICAGMFAVSASRKYKRYNKEK